MFRTYSPRGLWWYRYPYREKNMQLTASTVRNLQGRKPLELLTGETPDISEYLDFGWYNRVWYKEDAGLRETNVGRFLGPAHKSVSLMSSWVLPKSGIPISRTRVQRVIHLKIQTDANRKHFKHYDTAITEIFHEVYTQENSSAPSSENMTMEMWKDLADGVKEFQNELAILFDNTDVKEDDDQFTQDSYDNYINIEIALDQGGEQPKYERV